MRVGGKQEGERDNEKSQLETEIWGCEGESQRGDRKKRVKKRVSKRQRWGKR
jgi:hypothetical protein